MLLTNKQNSLEKATKTSPNIIKYRNYKGFNGNFFSWTRPKALLKGKTYNLKDPYSKLTEIFQEILKKHAPLKSKQVRGNHAPFMNKELSKVIIINLDWEISTSNGPPK